MSRHIDGPHVDRDTGEVTGTIELPGGLPPDPEDEATYGHGDPEVGE